MDINRNNYELFFLLYADKELSEQEMKAVENFAAAHPDLKSELDMILQTVLPVEATTEFLDKESLFRTADTDSLVNMTNYESYFVKYADDELTNFEKAATEDFVYKHPECQVEFELFQQTRLTPDTSIQFPDKSILYRQEEVKRRPVMLMWTRFAAAAAVILIAGLIWMQQRQAQPTIDTKPIAGKVDAPQPVIDTNKKPNILKETADIPSKQIAKTNSANPVEQPKKNKTLQEPTVEPSPAVQQQLLATNDQEKTIAPEIVVKVPATLPTLASPTVEVNKIPVNEKALAQNQDFASKAASEDYIYVDNTPDSRKSPLRGLMRKASRYAELKNPLTSEHRKGGVFTASQE